MRFLIVQAVQLFRCIDVATACVILSVKSGFKMTDNLSIVVTHAFANRCFH